jgi:hypothetical protein
MVSRVLNYDVLNYWRTARIPRLRRWHPEIKIRMRMVVIKEGMGGMTKFRSHGAAGQNTKA